MVSPKYKTMKKPARLLAVEILNRVEESDAFAEPLLDACLSGNSLADLRDRRLLTQLVYGTLRMQGRLDWIIDKLYRGKAGSLETGIRNILRTGLYQLLFTDKIPVFAVLDETVKTAKIMYPGRTGLVNAILRNALRKKKEIPYPSQEEDPALHCSILHSHPLWLVKKWIDAFGPEETAALCKANNEIPPLTIRVNRLKAMRADMIEIMRRDGFGATATVFSPDGIVLDHPPLPLRETDYYRKGLIQVQDEASQLIARLVAPQPGENILDLCAGVGVKTTHLAELMGNRGSITAVDINANKITALRELTERRGITIIDAIVSDATADLGREFQGKFDRILLDAPCSGLGTLRRNPEIKWRLRLEDIGKRASLQRALLANALRYLKRGGTLIYSTCTLMEEENEGMIEDFLQGQDNFRRTQLPEGIDSSLIDGKGFFRSSPHSHGTDGFFGVALERTG
jgi:16S rRNA (cytosine967-C5)-methyltransferase